MMEKLLAPITLVASLILTIVISLQISNITKVVPVFIGTANRLDVNEIVKNDVDFWVKSYSTKEKISTKVSRAIIEKSIKYNIPVNVAFALAYEESNYKLDAYNKNKDSYDYGLFQLNNLTFGDVKKNYREPDKNAEAALAYLKELYDVYGSFDLSLVAFNCGRVKRFNEMTQDHVRDILLKEKEMDEWFNKAYRDSIELDNWATKTYKKITTGHWLGKKQTIVY